MLKRVRKKSIRAMKKILGKKIIKVAPNDPELFKDAVDSGLFDAHWYQQQHKLYFNSAEQAFNDYLRKSRFANVAPSPNFDPVSYFHNNPDVYASGYSPLYHYLRFGRFEGRQAYPLRDLWAAKNTLKLGEYPNKRKKRYAVVLHIFYDDFIQRFHNAFLGVDFEFDLFVTTTSKDVKGRVEEAFSKNPKVNDIKICISPNQGRNFGPFLVEFADELMQYDFMCHMHSKKSLYSGSEQIHWAEYLIEYLARDKQVLNNMLNILENDESIGLYYPTTFWNMPQWTCHWLKNKAAGLTLLKDWFDIDINKNKDYFSYPAGGMFWARIEALKPLLERDWSYDKFPVEPIPADGTVLHIIERILPLLAANRGYNSLYYYPATGTFTKDENFIFLEYMYGLDFRMNMLCQQNSICSFDVFDTLVWRKYYVPDYAKFLLPEWAGLSIDGKEFVCLRNEAELSIRKSRNFKGDVSIIDVYQQLANEGIIEESQVEELSDLEFELDLSMIRPKEKMVEFVNRLGGEGKEIYIITDTYYTSKQIDRLLAVSGIVAPYKLFVSSDNGMRKDTGAVWSHLSKYLKKHEKMGEFVHIGDNVGSDSQIPGDFGLRTLHILAPKDKWQALNLPVLSDIESLDNLKEAKRWGLLVAKTGQNSFI